MNSLQKLRWKRPRILPIYAFFLSKPLDWKHSACSSMSCPYLHLGIYNPGQNYVGQACRIHCLDHRSVFHMEKNVLWAKSYLTPPPPPPLPHAIVLFVRKGLPTSRPTLHRGGRGERANIAAIREKGTLSHIFWPGLSISRTFTTNAHNSKCMECTVSKFVWVKFVHVLHTSLTSWLWKNSFVAISQRFRGQQT